MADLDDESLNLDNSDDEAIPSGVETLSVEEDDEIEPEDTELESQAKGNLSVALKQERERRKQAELDREQLRRDLEMRDYLLSKAGSKQDIDPEEARRELQTRMWDRPDEVLMQNNQILLQRIAQQNAPLVKAQAEGYLLNHPEYRDIYSHPDVKPGIDAYINESVQTTGSLDFNKLNDAMNYFVSLKKAFGGASQAPQPSTKGKEKLSSTVSKGNAGNTTSLSDEEIWRKALKLPHQKYAEWENDPKNKALLQRVLQGSKQK